MTQPALLAEIWRGPIVESTHFGHVVIRDDTGQIVESWGNPAAQIYPRSSAKMIQALPLVASGAAEAFGLSGERLALACSSHQGAPLHVGHVRQWLDELGLSDDDLRCGPQVSRDPDLRDEMIRAHETPCQVHNNCSGKHTGFLTLSRHLRAGPEYVDPDHPVQKACKEAFEEVTGEDSPGFGIDGCSAPNFITTMAGMARAMSWYASARKRDDVLSRAASKLVTAMMSFPELVAGEGRACTLLMRAASEPVALKTGAEGYFVAILPERGLGVAVKAADGGTRAAECAIAAVLVRLGVLPADHPDVQRFLNPPILNRRGLRTGEIRPAGALLG